MIAQWGRTTNGGKTTKTVSYPIAFESSVYTTTLTETRITGNNSSTATWYHGMLVLNLTTTSFQIYSTVSEQPTLCFIALGM